ncbi:carbon storage regulator [Patescibacteria group bacterium]|nr:carbon storage regulator [Patescibacteria group bacterium]
MGNLVLTRKIGEKIVIKTPKGDLIKIAISRIDNSEQARIAIEAKKDYNIYREELEDRIKINNITPSKDKYKYSKDKLLQMHDNCKHSEDNIIKISENLYSQIIRKMITANTDKIYVDGYNGSYTTMGSEGNHFLGRIE